MHLVRNRFVALPLLGLMAGVGMGAIQGCDPGDLAEQCGLTCDADAFVEGRANVSGVASIDAFFGAAIRLNASMRDLNAHIRAELDAIAVSVGLEPGAGGAEISAAVQAHLDLYVSGGLQIQYQPPECRASVEATLAASAECDVEVDPGMATVSCEGSCQAEAGVAVDCGAEATLRCEGTAPGFDCSGGTCTGSCVADVSGNATCDGTCRGTCTAGASTMDGFEGRCNGTCEGTCEVELEAGGSCDARCEGSCDYVAPEGGCDASATARCEAMAGASIECDAGCEGSVEPPSVSAECEASVEASASASIECTPPTLAIGFEFNGTAAGDVMAQAEFRAWLEGFRGHFSALLAARVQAEAVIDAAGNLAASAGGAVSGAVDDLKGSGDLSASVGAACALGQLPTAGEAITSASGELAASASASVEVISGFAG